jgi:hypothetical protein
MASVTSLDKDMRQLRMDRYTPQAAKEVRTFIEEALGERLQQTDLLDALKDGVALCRYNSYPISDILFLTIIPWQVGQPCSTKCFEIQNPCCYAVRTDGKHLAVPSSLQKPTL